MSNHFGEWVKEQRSIHRISQERLAKETGVSQSVISRWELSTNEKPNPSIENMIKIMRRFGYTMRIFPWNCVEDNNGSGWEIMSKRFNLYELPTASSVKTFEGKTYELKGYVGVEEETGEVRHITDLYYQTRSVVSDKRVLAKRRKITDELTKVNGVIKVK